MYVAEHQSTRPCSLQHTHVFLTLSEAWNVQLVETTKLNDQLL